MDCELIGCSLIECTLPPIAKVTERINQSFSFQSFCSEIDNGNLLTGMRLECLYTTGGHKYTVIGDSPDFQILFHIVYEQTDISYYDRNRETLYNGLKELGFECIKPEGAFYLFVKSPVADEKEFCNAAKKHNILLVPGSSFGCPGYVRMAYCVAYETIINSLPKFKELAEEYK